MVGYNGFDGVSYSFFLFKCVEIAEDYVCPDFLTPRCIKSSVKFSFAHVHENPVLISLF